VSSSPLSINLLSNNAISSAANSGLMQEPQRLHRSVRSAFPVSDVSDGLAWPPHVVSHARHTAQRALRSLPVSRVSRRQRSVDTLQESTSGTPIERPEMALDDPARSVNADAAPSCLESHQDKVPDLNDASQYVIELLKKNGGVPAGCDRSAHAIVRSAIVFAERDMNSHAALASAIQKARGHYGGHVAEVLLAPVQKLIIRDWVTRTILGDDIATLLESVILVTERPTHLTSRHLSQLLKNELSDVDSDSFILQEWLVKNVILEQLPILRQFFISDGPKDPGWQRAGIMKLHDFEFGLINAGLRFAHSLGLDIGPLSVETAAQWGTILLAQLQEGVVPPQWWSFFQLPAIIRYTQNNPDLMKGLSSEEKQDMRTRALIDYSSSYEEWIEKHNPVAKFKRLMAGYTTRPQLAKQYKDVYCPEMNVSDYLNRVSVTCVEISEKSQHPLDKFPRPKSVHTSQLPDIPRCQHSW
jgi:hypothetical protein